MWMDRQTDAQPDMTKLIVAFRSFVNASIIYPITNNSVILSAEFLIGIFNFI